MAMKVGWGATCHTMANVEYLRIDIVNNKMALPGNGAGTLIGVNPRITHTDKPVLITNFSYTDIWYVRRANTTLPPVFR